MAVWLGGLLLLTRVVLAGPGGRRTVPASEFFVAFTITMTRIALAPFLSVARAEGSMLVALGPGGPEALRRALALEDGWLAVADRSGGVVQLFRVLEGRAEPGTGR